MHVIAIGVDSETKHGKPITFQFYAPEIDVERITWLDGKEKQATKLFFQFLDSLPKTRDRHYILFGHNLAFDMISFFYDRYTRLREESIKNEKWYGWNVDLVYAHVRFANFKKGNMHVSLIDTGAYFMRKLSVLGDMVCPDLPKLEMPEGLGQKSFTHKDKLFCDYAMRDAVIAYHIGMKLLDFHNEMDVSLAVSAPHFASKVFRRSFLKKSIPLPSYKVVYSAMSAYHGGKNNLAERGLIKQKIYSIDIRSAYPHAMRSLPSFSNLDLYRTISGKGQPSSDLPPFGIYKISGFAKSCKWPILFDHSFKPIQGKEFKNIWTTGHELNEGIRSKELAITDLFGYFYDAEADTEPSPFAGYVDYFFKNKETAKDKIYREFFKLLLNSLYGKFIQTRNIAAIQNLEYNEDTGKISEDKLLLAGGLFNPFIAALITGHTRSVIHRLEHKYKALHTSTDGIMSRTKGKESAGLGGLSIEADADITIIFRNKLYIMYAKATAADKKDKKVLMSAVFKGYKIIKYALHGFHGTVQTLEMMYKTKTKEYEYVKVNKLRESISRGLQVNDFVSRSSKLNLPEDE